MAQNKSYIVPDGETLELDEAWFGKARRGLPRSCCPGGSYR